MTPTDLNDLQETLRCAYGSLDEPHYGNIVKRLKENFEQHVVDNLLSANIAVENAGDENDDVAAILIIRKDGDDVSVELSAVGPYASVREPSPGRRKVWVARPEDALTPLGKTAARIVTDAGYRLLDRETALRTISMNRWDGSTEATLYRALFTDTDWVP